MHHPPRLSNSCTIATDSRSDVQILKELSKDITSGAVFYVHDLPGKAYRVDYIQDPRDEYDFTIRNLAIDLRNGLCLCKAAQLLTGQSAILQANNAQSRMHVA